MDTGPLKLECPCGEPLDLVVTKDGKWVLGHLSGCCSPMVSADNPGDLLMQFAVMERMPTFEEYRAGTGPVVAVQIHIPNPRMMVHGKVE